MSTRPRACLQWLNEWWAFCQNIADGELRSIEIQRIAESRPRPEYSQEIGVALAFILLHAPAAIPLFSQNKKYNWEQDELIESKFYWKMTRTEPKFRFCGRTETIELPEPVREHFRSHFHEKITRFFRMRIFCARRSTLLCSCWVRGRAYFLWLLVFRFSDSRIF